MYHETRRPEWRPIDEGLYYQAVRGLRDISSIRQRLHEIRQYPERFKTRVNEFEITSQTLSALLRQTNLDPNKYENVIELKKLLDVNPTDNEDIIDVRETHGKVHWGKKTEDIEALPLIQKVEQTVDQLKERLRSGEIKFPTHATDDYNQLATFLLIEGAGLF